MSAPIQYPAILIIAAGQSKRLGSPKQLLVFEGETLINRQIRIITSAVDVPVYLVLGAHATSIKAQLKDHEVTVVINDQWQEGMASSIRVGVDAIMNKNPSIDGVMIVVCDQPFLDASIIQSIFSLQKSSLQSIVACSYDGIIGTPVLFHKTMFEKLLALEGDIGARKIINDNPDEVSILSFEKGIVDIDTLEDYQKLVKEAASK
jgi:molybdenum cofactor cytidylyltransferase